MQKTKARAASAQTWSRSALPQLSMVRPQAAKGWSTTVREKRPLSLKHLRGLGCSSDY